MKTGWQTERLGDLCSIELGKTPARANKAFWDEERATGNVWLSIADLLNTEGGAVVDSKEYLSDAGAAISKIVREGTLLVSFKLTLGRLAFAGRDLFTNEAIAALTIFDESKLSKRFLYYFLHFFDWRKAAQDDVKLKGMTLNKAKLKEIPIRFPLPAEQERIVRVLDEAFEDLASATSLTDRNARNARLLFDSHLQSVFAQGSIGWEKKRLRDVCVLINGRAYKKHEMLATGKYPLLRVGNFFTNRGWFYSDLELPPDKYCDDGDLLYAWSASFGPRIWDGGRVIYHYHIWKVLPNEAIVTKRFLLYLLEWDVDQIKKAHGTGTTMMHVSKESMEKRLVPIAPKKEQPGIVARLDELKAETHRLVTIYEKKLDALAALKESILHEVFGDEIGVRAA